MSRVAVEREVVVKLREELTELAQRALSLSLLLRESCSDVEPEEGSPVPETGGEE